MVMPGSLDHLYYGGVIDHIPYEAYAISSPVALNAYAASGYGTGIRDNNGLLKGSHYLDYAKQGLAYNTYAEDSFNGISSENFIKKQYSKKQVSQRENYDGENLGASLSREYSKVSSNPILKGLLSLGLILATGILLVKGSKKVYNNSSVQKFISKLNPKNWFKS